MQSTHDKFGESDGFKETTYTRCLFINGSHEPTNHQNLRDLYSSYLFLKRLQNCDSPEDLSSYVNDAKAITAYNNLDATFKTPQYSVKKVISIFGEAGTKAVLKEIQKIHQGGVISAMDLSNMTVEQRNRVLDYLKYLKQKQNGDIKAWGCADGRGQREFISKEETSAPNVLLYALLITCMINSSE